MFDVYILCTCLLCRYIIYYIFCNIFFSQDERLMTPGDRLSGKHPPNGGRSLSVEQEELINRLVYFQDEFEQPSEEDLKRLSVS